MEVVTTSTVPAPAEEVWRRLVTPEGINHPLDYDDLGLAELGPGFRFVEQSSMDSLVGPLTRAILTRMLAHRHRRLAAYFVRVGRARRRPHARVLPRLGNRRLS